MKKLSIIYDVTSRCPFNCPICCNGSGSAPEKNNEELTLSQKLELASQIAALRDYGYNVRVDLSGGEIFTNKAENNELIKALSMKLGSENVGISCSGFGIDDAQAQFLATYAPDVEMTFDTVPYRKYVFRPDNYSITAIKAATRLKDFGVKVGMQTVVTKTLANYADAEAVFAYLCAKKIDCWSILRFFPSGRGADYPYEAMNDDECLEYVKMVQEIVLKSKADFKPKVDFHYTMPGHEKYSSLCRCVRHSIGILPNGNVVACFWAVDSNTDCIDPKYLLGNVKEQSLIDILNGERARYWSDCEHCCELDVFDTVVSGGEGNVLPA